MLPRPSLAGGLTHGPTAIGGQRLRWDLERVTFQLALSSAGRCFLLEMQRWRLRH